MDVLGMCLSMTTFAVREHLAFPTSGVIGTGHPQHCAWACRFMKRPIGCHNKAGDVVERFVDDWQDRSWIVN